MSLNMTPVSFTLPLSGSGRGPQLTPGRKEERGEGEGEGGRGEGEGGERGREKERGEGEVDLVHVRT